MIKVGSFQRLNISGSKTLSLQNQVQIFKVASCHQLMSQPWNIVTQSTSEDSIYKSEMSRLWNPTQMIKVFSCQGLIPRTWKIVTAEVVCPLRETVHILCKPHLPDSYYRDFENLNENMSLASLTKCDRMISDPIQTGIIYFNFYF